MLFEAEIRRFTEYLANAGAAALRGTPLGSLAVGQTEPPNMELSRANRRFVLGNSAAITGIAPVQALPTTAAQWAIFNTDNKKSIVLEEIGMYLTSGTPGVGGILLAALFIDPAQTGANVAGATIASASKANNNSTIATIKTGITITTPAAPVWYPIASNPSPNVTAFAASTFLEHRNLQGAIIIPPKQGLGLNVVAPAGTTPLFAPFARWAELAIDLE